MTSKSPKPESKEKIEQTLKCMMDSHGFSFQSAVVHHLQELHKNSSEWLLEVAEFPTTVNGADARIDFIIRPQGTRFFLISECKRVNPAFGNWCFVRAPFVRRARTDESVFLEKITVNFPDGNFAGVKSTKSEMCTAPATGREFHLGFEVKTDAKGDQNGGGARRTFEEHAGQIFRGTNGIAEMLAMINPHNTLGGLLPKLTTSETYLMPAIFTTARLWTSDIDISQANLECGELPSAPSLTEAKWLIWQYPVSPGLRHSLPRNPLGYEFAEILDPEFMRSVAVVSAGGIRDFVREFRSPWFFYPRI